MELTNQEIKCATDVNLAEIKDLLIKNDLPSDDVSGLMDSFLIAHSNGDLSGIICLQSEGHYGLLRSFVVKEDFRNQGIGKLLFDELMNCADNKNLSDVYLLTYTARKYFEKKGFKLMERKFVPEEILKTSEFSSNTCAKADCMHLKLK